MEILIKNIFVISISLIILYILLKKKIFDPLSADRRLSERRFDDRRINERRKFDVPLFCTAEYNNRSDFIDRRVSSRRILSRRD